MSLIIGLDVSTAVTGYTVLDQDGKLVELGYIDTTKEKATSLWTVADKIRHEISRLSVGRQYSHLYIEENLQTFRSGFSSAHTIATLAKINGIVSYMARLAFNIEPTYISSAVARRECGLKILKPKTPADKKNPRYVKQQVYEQMVLLHPVLVQQPWPITKPSKVNPQGRLQDCCYDMMDSFVIAVAGLKQHI